MKFPRVLFILTMLSIAATASAADPVIDVRVIQLCRLTSTA